ncbi:hypothetical protein CsSME_00015101 [Camellia sinensis var. sinensis]
MCCSELLTGVVPYTDLRAEVQAHAVLEMNCTEQQLTAAVVSEGLRPALAGHSSSAPTGFPSLIQRCWDANPQNRPSFDDIILELDPILECRKRVEEDEKEKALVDPSIPLGDEGIPSLLAYQKAYHPVLSWGSFGTCGRRETMEDTHFLMPHMCGEKDIHVFGIFDGHRGAAAAEFSARALPGFLQSLGSIKRFLPFYYSRGLFTFYNLYMNVFNKKYIFLFCI